jgi:hypothetical protein
MCWQMRKDPVRPRLEGQGWPDIQFSVLVICEGSRAEPFGPKPQSARCANGTCSQPPWNSFLKFHLLGGWFSDADLQTDGYPVCLP